MHPSDVVRKYIRPGTVLGERYEVEDFIGSGAYGSIFTAIDKVTMERVAVKALPPPDSGVNETALGRFQREMKVVASIRHPNVITMYDYGETENHLLFMVLEYLDGATLYDVVNGRRLPAGVSLSVTRQIAKGLKAAHDLGIVHRDLKPQNIMLMERRGGEYDVKVLDFGMAKLLERVNDESIIQLTREGVAVGTPRYIAPEQARGQAVGPFSDLYALGLLFYEMITGARAVKADSVETAIMAHVSRKPLQLDEIELVPEEYRPMLRQMIDKNHRRRYQTADEVIAEIERLERSERHAAVAAKGGRVVVGPGPATGPPAANKADLEDKEERLRSIHSADNLELDFDRYDRLRPAEGEGAPRVVTTSRGRPLLRIPETNSEIVEALLAVALAPLAFVFLSAHMWDSGLLLRAFVGGFPFLVALSVSLVAATKAWRWSFFRLFLIANVLGFLGSHLILTNLAVGLLKNPSWFIDPIDFVPGATTIGNAIAALARAHVQEVLMPMSIEVVREVANML